MVAHHIAHLAYEGNSSFGWDGDPSDFIRCLILNDVIVLNNVTTM
jgi:hypothetical protein